MTWQNKVVSCVHQTCSSLHACINCIHSSSIILHACIRSCMQRQGLLALPQNKETWREMMLALKNGWNACKYWDYNHLLLNNQRQSTLRKFNAHFLYRNLLHSQLDYFMSVFVLREYAFTMLNILSKCLLWVVKFGGYNLLPLVCALYQATHKTKEERIFSIKCTYVWKVRSPSMTQCKQATACICSEVHILCSERMPASCPHIPSSYCHLATPAHMCNSISIKFCPPSAAEAGR